MRKALLRFYAEHARDLPWRRSADPYAIWVSEVMLQQTRVDTVLRYYEPFLARFPSTHALAQASQDEVLSAWSGLGYYRRARLLHEGVRQVVAQYAGQVPQDPQLRLGLPGVGRYTAGAIGSIAFGQPEPIVDGNVARVLARVHAIDTPLGRADTQAQLWRLAEQLVSGPRPGELNQALMELGATLCSKASPRCAQCPLRRSCQARKQQRVHELPVAAARRAPRAVKLVLVAVSGPDATSVVLSRGQDSLFGGLWNLPMSQGSGAACARKTLRALGIKARCAALPVARFHHQLTHLSLAVQVYRAKLPQAALLAESGELRLLARAELGRVGVSSLTRKALDCALGDEFAAFVRT